MRLTLLPLAALAAIGVVPPSAQAPIVATPAEPELIETSVSGFTFPLTDAAYLKEAQRLATDPRFIAMRKKPVGLSAEARFGVGFVLEEKNRSWAIDGDTESGFTFYGDLNGNGDLSDDAPRRFVDEQGKPTLRISQSRRGEDGRAHQVVLKLQLDMMPPPNSQEKALALVRYATTRRRGEVTLDPAKPPLVFRMTGPQGLFNLDYGSISFDFDGDGAFDPDLERYVNTEKYVNAGGATYEFSADKHGDRVTFTKLAAPRPDRLKIKAGYRAPDFSFTDLRGASYRLSDFRGRVVLLDFWATWCGPCVGAVPELVRLYSTYHARGFEIIGIEAKDPRDKVAAFIAEHQMPWTQTLEPDTGPIATLFRIGGWPTAFLVGPDGKFLSANYLGEVKLADELAKAFPEK